MGTPQGAVISPLLANVYLHYVFDLWIEWWRKHHATGTCGRCRYADDFVIGWVQLQARMRPLAWKHSGTGSPSSAYSFTKTKQRLIEFGRFAAEPPKVAWGRRPETFDFLGFTHYCGTERITGWYVSSQASQHPEADAADAGVDQGSSSDGGCTDPLGETGRWLRSCGAGLAELSCRARQRPRCIRRFVDEVKKHVAPGDSPPQPDRTQSAGRGPASPASPRRYLPRPRILHPYP